MVARTHTCDRLDHLLRIVNNRMDWRTVWTDNSELQSTRGRRNPNVLYTGPQGDVDQIVLNEPDTIREEGDTDAEHTVEVRRDQLYLRLRILKGDFTPVANADYRLVLEGVTDPLEGSTDGDGKIEVPIPITATTGELSVRVTAEDSDAAPPQAAGDEGDGEGEAGEGEESDAVRGNVPCSWQIQIGALNPILEQAPNLNCMPGIQARLNNLGFDAGPITGATNPTTRAAIETFQSMFNVSLVGGTGDPHYQRTQEKLKQIHDDAGAAGTLEEPELRTEIEEGTLVDTPPDAIGHVAPDLDPAVKQEVLGDNSKFFNSLVLRPTYRITLELGDLDSIFPDGPESDRGRMERLQCLGYLYEPLNRRRAAADAFQHVWNWYTAAAPDGLQRTQDDLVTELREELVEDGSLPPPGEFRKVTFPGSFCYESRDGRGALNNSFPKQLNFLREAAMWNANGRLGRIPVIAKVERKLGDDSWGPAPRVWVYLQMQTPDDLPDDYFEEDPRAADQTATQARWAGTNNPSDYVDDHVENPTEADPNPHEAPDGDPQVDNTHRIVGGKRGLQVAGSMIEVSARRGLHRRHRPARDIENRPPWGSVPQRARARGRSHRNAVRARTNANGETIFVFRPARNSADRYKLRAYVGPGTLNNDGTGIGAVAVDTGTLVSWRLLRFSHYLVWDYPAGYVSPAAPPAPPPAWTVRQDMDFRIRNMANIDLEAVADEFRKAGIQVIVHNTAARRVIPLAEWERARTHSLDRMRRANRRINLDAMFPGNNTTPCMLRIADRDDYNNNRNNDAPPNFPAQGPLNPTTVPQLNRARVAYWRLSIRLFETYLNGFIHYFTRNALPFTVIQAPFGDSYTFDVVVPAADGYYLTTSGQASPNRGCFLWWGTDFYNVFSYPGGVDSNTVHETGHCHYAAHHWNEYNTAGNLVSTGCPRDHDNEDICVMGYMKCLGDFCGRCLLRLRGWNLRRIPRNRIV